MNEETNWSHDMSRHIIPQEAWEEDEHDRVWDVYKPSTITDGIT